jgi:hypothetical protein
MRPLLQREQPKPQQQQQAVVQPQQDPSQIQEANRCRTMRLP